MPGRIEKGDKITRVQSKNDNTRVLPLTWKKNEKKRRPKKSENNFFRKIRGFRSGTN